MEFAAYFEGNEIFNFDNSSNLLDFEASIYASQEFKFFITPSTLLIPPPEKSSHK